MAKLNDLADLVRAYVYNCPTPVIDRALNYAARDFCKRTFAWREVQNVYLPANLSSADLDYDPGIAGLRVLQVLDPNDKPLGLDRGSDSFATPKSGTPKECATDDLLTLHFDAKPTSMTVYKVTMALIMPIGGKVIGDTVYNLWGEGVAEGAIHHLLMQPGRDWYDPQKATYHGSQYDSAVNEARRDANNGLVKLADRVQLNPFI